LPTKLKWIGKTIRLRYIVAGNPVCRSGPCPRNQLQVRVNIVGGSSTASHFFLLRQRKSNQKEGDPGLPPLRGSLDQPQASGAAQLDLVGRTPRAPLRDSNSARLNLRLLAANRGGAQGKEKQKMLCALCARLIFHPAYRCYAGCKEELVVWRE
jgi:hypothetical protein